MLFEVGEQAVFVFSEMFELEAATCAGFEKALEFFCFLPTEEYEVINQPPRKILVGVS